jgi:hypothetical protein
LKNIIKNNAVYQKDINHMILKKPKKMEIEIDLLRKIVNLLRFIFSKKVYFFVLKYDKNGDQHGMERVAIECFHCYHKTY